MIIFHFITILIALIGVFIFKFFALPMPWLLGSIVAISIGSRVDKLPLQKSSKLQNIARMTLGIILGSSFTPELLHYIHDYIYSLLFVVPFVILVAILGMWYYHKILGFDKVTAYFSAMPGGLVEMILLGKEFGANTAKVTLTQSMRMIFIVFSLPFLIQIISHTPLTDLKSITSPLKDILTKDIIIMIFIAIFGSYIGVKLKLFASYMIGPMLVSILVYGLGFIQTRPPDEILKAMQVIMGINIGLVFKGVKTREIIKTLINSSGFLVLLIIASGIISFLVHYLFGFSLISTILAFSPGGQANINLIAIIIGANIPYIALHHLFRLLLVIFAAGYFAKKIK